MLNWFNKNIIIISSVIIVTLLVITFIFPSIGGILGIAFLLSGFLLAGIVIIQRHREAYLQGKISRRVYIRNACLEIAGILLAMLLAAWIGNLIAQIATRQIDHTLIRFIAGIIIGLLIGIGVGSVVKKTWNRLLSIQ
jgi:hypothetical protein